MRWEEASETNDEPRHVAISDRVWWVLFGAVAVASLVLLVLMLLPQ